MKSLFGILMGLFVIAICIPAGNIIAADDQKQPKDEIMVIGNDFKLTQNEIKELRDHMEKGAHRLTEQGYSDYALQLKLFAKEAKVLKLEKSDELSEEIFKERNRLADMYAFKVMKEYKIDDLIIESYCLAHPEKYKSENYETVQLDDDTKKSIREIVLKEKKMLIFNAATEQLKKKYNIRICEAGGCNQ